MSGERLHDHWSSSFNMEGNSSFNQIFIKLTDN